MPSNAPITLSLPPFRGVARRIVLAGVAAFLVLFIARQTPLYNVLLKWLALSPAYFWRAPWQLLTYAFLPTSVMGSLFAMLSIWMFGATIEDERGSRWLLEYFVVTTAGGALLASLLALTGIFGPPFAIYTVGFWPAVTALLMAFARLHPDQPITLFFILPVKAKYLAAIYLLVYLALSITGGDRYGAATAVCACLAGFAYMAVLGRRGLAYSASEQVYGLRNAWIRAKRRRAAKKFAVYMREQGREVNIDPSGRYIDPDDPRHRKDPRRDPNDKRWMN